MGLPTITRGQGWRDDAASASSYAGSTDAGWSGLTGLSDGDFLTVTATATSAANGTRASVTITPTAISTTTYPKIIIRHKESWAGTNPTAHIKLVYADASTDDFALTTSSSYLAEPFSLTAGKTLSTIAVSMAATATLTGTFTETFDFIYLFKETLTLPTASKTVRQRVKRRIISVPIPFKEGDVLQDLGSESPEYDIAGQLITTGPYTADQWWGIFQGLLLETGTVQADGNPTWQWFTWDQGGAKVLIVNFVMDDNPGRLQNWDYQMQMKEFDVLSRSVANPVGGVLSTY